MRDTQEERGNEMAKTPVLYGQPFTVKAAIFQRVIDSHRVIESEKFPTGRAWFADGCGDNFYRTPGAARDAYVAFRVKQGDNALAIAKGHPNEMPTTPEAESIRFDLVGAIIEYESGEMDVPGFLALFSHLIKTGTAWTLQGFYGREAARLIENGIITPEGKLTAKANELMDEA